jgi:4-hydroxythreonine-4-phosphate dehydrogenase
MSDLDNTQLPVIGISCGDLNGIGMEIIIKTFANPEMMEICTPVVFASAKAAAYHRNAIDHKDFNFNIINDWSKLSNGKPNLFAAWKEEVNIEFGKVDPVVGSYAEKSLDQACQSLEEGLIDALVTAPIHKKSIQSDQFRFSGHTDYLESRFKAKGTMMLVSDEMRMALATVHIPLNKVTESVTAELLEEKIRSISSSLQSDFHIRKPKIAVLALNPHAGDHGVMGNEDEKLVQPTIEKIAEEGHLVYGPYPADSFFGAAKHRQFDAILALYHDQGLIPFKSLSFGKGVNYSAGLPHVRTSPDHGTAFEIAGQGIADESSFREAVYLACDLAKNRKLSKELAANPLKIKGKKK